MDKEPIRVLVAEDDYLVAQEIKRTLRGKKYEVVGDAGDGVEALKMILELKPDVVLMDIKMPLMDGLEASLRVQEQSPTPIVILTAHESMDLAEEAAKVGVGAYLTKPPSAVEIDRAIAITMARHEDMKRLRSLNQELTKALGEIKILKGVLPLCCVCGVIRDDTGVERGKGKWMKMDSYITEKTEAKISHTYCPECYNETVKQINNKP